MPAKTAPPAAAASALRITISLDAQYKYPESVVEAPAQGVNKSIQCTVSAVE